MDSLPAIGAVSSVIASTVKIAEKTFEICAVDDQAKAVLQTVNQVNRQLNNARLLRRQRSSLFTVFEKSMIDETFSQTEDAVQQVATLTERARVDMEVSGGKVKMNTRLLYVLRDSPNIHVSLTKLGIASQSLTMALFMLTNRFDGEQNLNLHPDMKTPSRPPPTYAESNFIAEKRLKNAQRRASAQNLGAKSLGTRSRSTSSLFSLAYTQCDEEATLELEGVEPERLPTRASSRSVPTIHVSQSASKADDIDFLLFQEATSFTPPPTKETWPPPIQPFPFNMTELHTDVETFANLTPIQELRPKSTPADNRWPPPAGPTPLNTKVHEMADFHVTASPEQRPRGFSKPIEMQSDEDSVLDIRVAPDPAARDHSASLPAQQAWEPPTAPLPRTIEAQSDDLPIPNFLYTPIQRPRGWSSSARLQANELYMEPHATTVARETVRPGSTYPPPRPPKPPELQQTARIAPPYPCLSPVAKERQTRESEQARLEANEPYIDWYSPGSFSSKFSTVALPTQPSAERKGRTGRWYDARCE